VDEVVEGERPLPSLGIATLLRYLIGDRSAILAIADTRHTLWVGLLFVLSAGLAREYDGEDLLHEPWHALLPLTASLASSFLLFTLAYGIALLKGAPWRAVFSNYLTFLGLFWMTAPLAWLYAIPYEQFLSPADAMRANLLTLALVSVWRVALMVRVLQVILSYDVWAGGSLVLLFADGVALWLLTLLPVPLLALMGGVRLSEREQVLYQAGFLVFQLGFCSLPFWFVGAFAVLYQSKPAWQPSSVRLDGRPSVALRCLAFGSVLVWAIILPFTQPAQILRRGVERAFATGRIAEALAEMSRHRQADFPPGWEPPPGQVDWWQGENDLERALQELARGDSADWVREAYLDKTARMLRGIDDFALTRVAAILCRVPDGASVVTRLEAQQDKNLAAKVRRMMKGEPLPD
jgi:hypothetical protein